MITPDLSDAVWRKSSRSGSNADCVEIAELADAVWHKSTRSGSDTDCVEVAELTRAVAVRDSKDRTGPVLAFDRAAWSHFLADLPERS